jgi:hypothetical protein
VAMGHDRRSAAGKAGLPLRGSLVQNDGIRTPICRFIYEFTLSLSYSYFIFYSGFE